MKNRFEKAIRVFRQAGYDDIAERLTMEMETMAAEVYKIAVVGEFKSGKSTLINKVFLQDDVLVTDIIEATAVPTEIRYSRDKYLEIVPYDTRKYQRPNPFENGVLEDVEEIRDEGEPFKILDPSAEDIKKFTAAESSEGRARLAGKIARAKLGWPAVHIAGLAVFDTPGINSINEAVIATTYRVVPESDLVLFLTNSRQLSGVEMEFLSGRVLSEGIARVMLVVTYDPHSGILQAPQRKKLLDAIRGQLAGIGQGNIPVEMVDIRGSLPKREGTEAIGTRLEGEAGGKGTKDVRKAVDSVIGDLLGEKLPPSPSIGEKICEDVDEAIGIAALEEKLVRFIRENVRPGRMEKADRVLQKQVRLAKIRCEAEMAALGKSDVERERLMENLREREKCIRYEHETISTQLKEDLQRIHTLTSTGINSGLDIIAMSYADGFDRCDNMGELQERLNLSAALLKMEIEDLFVEASAKVRVQIEALSDAYQLQSQNIMNPLREENGRDIVLDGGVFANVPPSAVLALDFSLFVLFGPFRPLARVIVRLLANEIPFLNKILPASVASNILKGKIKRSLVQQFDRIKLETTGKLKLAFDQVGSSLVSKWRDNANEQLDSVRAGLEKATGHPDNRSRLTTLSKLEHELNRIR